MSCGYTARHTIRILICSFAGLLASAGPAMRVAAQSNYRPVSAGTASSVPAPEAPISNARVLSIPEYQPPENAVANPAPPNTRNTRPNAPSASRLTAQPIKVAQTDAAAGRSPEPQQARPAAPPVPQADPQNRQTAPSADRGAQGAGSRSGLLSESTDDGILPPPDDYQITQEEAALLDQFLQKWEEFGKNIKKVACSVETQEKGGGLYGEDKDAPPLSHNFGEFKFIAPNKLLYHVLGEYVYEKEVDGKKKPEYKEGLGEKKIVLDGKSFTEYDFKKRVALVTPIPEEQQNKDLTMDGPIPIFFIAKAENLKRRFYMKLITKPEKQASEVWIEAWPRQAADGQSFQRIIILLRLSDLQPYYMRQYHTNGKSYTELWFYDIAVNKGLWTIEPKVDFGWKKEEATPSSVTLLGN